MPVTITPAIPDITINGNTYTHSDWENNTPGTLSAMANDLATIIAAESLVGVLSKAISGDTTLTGTESENLGFIFTGSLSAGAAVTFAAGFQGIAAVVNATSGGFAITCGLAAGDSVSVPAGGSAMLFCDGTDFFPVTPIIRTSGGGSISGAMSISGAATVGGAATISGTASVAGAMTISGAALVGTGFHGVGTGQFDGAVIPTPITWVPSVTLTVNEGLNAMSPARMSAMLFVSIVTSPAATVGSGSGAPSGSGVTYEPYSDG